jgi:hypothetical protein
VFFSFITGLRCARRIGDAERKESGGDLHGALKTSAETLEILGSGSIELEAPWCRSAASVALWSYCRVARKLGLEQELRDTLFRWRTTYRGWMHSPATPDERTYLQWFEELLSDDNSGADRKD